MGALLGLPPHATIPPARKCTVHIGLLNQWILVYGMSLLRGLPFLWLGDNRSAPPVDRAADRQDWSHKRFCATPSINCTHMVVQTRLGRQAES